MWFRLIGLLTLIPGVGWLTGLVGPLLGAATPFITAALALTGAYLKRLWEGLTDIFDNPSTILTVASLILATYIYVNSYVKEDFIETRCVDKQTKQPVRNWQDRGWERFKDVFTPN